MFEIRCLVTKKHLSDVIVALDGLTVEPPVIKQRKDLLSEPVGPKHIKPKHGDVSARKTLEEFVHGLIKKGAKQITAEQLRKRMADSGFSAHSYSYPLALLIKSKVLRSIDKGIYEVV